jgi:hypothetical protein
MQLFLNHTHHKILVSDMDAKDKLVSVVSASGIKEFIFKGFVTQRGADLIEAELDIILVQSHFYGTSGFRVSDNLPWYFSSQKLKAVICNQVVFCLTQEEGLPVYG